MKQLRIITALVLIVTLLAGCSTKPVVQTEAPTTVATEAVTTSAPTTAAPTTTATEAPETEAPTTAAQAETEVPAYEFNAPKHKFTRDNFPKMDGSTASVPMGQAITSFLLNEDFDSVADLCKFNRTTQSFRNLMNGDSDILVVGEPNAAVYDEMKEAGFECEIEDIATDALIFVVNENNPVESLTTKQIRDIYSGKITNWKEVGGEDREIIPFQRNEGAGSQALIKKLIMGSTEMTEAPKEYVASEMGELMEAVKYYDNSSNAIGYSVYYYANDMKMATGLKIIKVDGVEPNDDTIRSREYPHLNSYYCVIPKNPDRSTSIASAKADGAKAIKNWLVTEDGQKLIASMGYVSVMDVGKGKVNKSEIENVFKVPAGRKAGEMGELTGADHGALIPYEGGALYENYGGGDAYIAGYMKGFFTEDGTLVTDPSYSDITRLSWWDSETHSEILIPMYEYTVRSEEIWNEEYDYYDAESIKKFVTTDGKAVSDKEYGVISGKSAGVMCLDSYDSAEFDFFDYEGNLLFTEKDVLKANPEIVDKEIYWPSLDMNGDFITLDVDYDTYVLDGETFKIISGPYRSIGSFINGTATAFIGDNGCVIDSDMNLVIPDKYSYVLRLSNGNFAAKGYDGITTVFNPDGKEIARTAGGSSGMNVTSYGFEESDYDSVNHVSHNMYYDCDGKLLFDDETGLFYSNTGNSILSGLGDLRADGTLEPSSDAQGVLLVNIVTGKQKYFEGYGSANPFYTLESQADIPFMTLYTIGERYEEDSCLIIDMDFNVVYEGTGGNYAKQDEVTGNWYIVQYDNWEDNKYTVYNDRMELYAKDIESFNSISNGLITRTTEKYFEALKPDGTVVFRYSFATAMND